MSLVRITLIQCDQCGAQALVCPQQPFIDALEKGWSALNNYEWDKGSFCPGCTEDKKKKGQQ